MKYIYLFLSIMFVLFAALQYNDPDPYLWAPYYLMLAAVCFFQFRLQRYNWLIWLALAVTIVWAVIYIPDVIEYFKVGAPSLVGTMKASTPYIENMREFGGLMICLVTLIAVVAQKPVATTG